MTAVEIHTSTIRVNLNTGCDIKDITENLNQAIQGSKIDTGIINISVVGSTGSVTTIEFEPGVVEDLKKAINSIAPTEAAYEHEKAWHDGNGHSHVQAALLGPSITLPVRFSRMKLGTWQQVVVINHDNRSRNRVIEVSILGN